MGDDGSAGRGLAAYQDKAQPTYRETSDQHRYELDMITLDEARANVGRRVVYRSPAGDKVESGVVTSANGWYVFVRYDGSVHEAGVATRGADLEWEHP